MSKQQWIMDPVHSEIVFKVRHMMITNVSGTFDDSSATMLSDAKDFSDAEIKFEAKIASVNTRNAQRDEHLRSSDFFEAASFPTLSFASTSFTKKSDNDYVLTGQFTLRGVTKSVSFDVVHTGMVVDSWGQIKAGFEITGVINRLDFNVVWNTPTEDGRVALADEIKIMITAQMIKKI